jgi:hypothetical protein
MRIVVGAPVRRREWLAEQYVDHIAWATVEAGISDADLTLMFVSHKDDPTNIALEKAAAVYGFETIFIPDDEPPTVLERSWEPERLHTMVRVRNSLLRGVRELDPDLFLSLDSDILLNSKALRCMIRLLETTRSRSDRPVASSHCVYLDQFSTRFPNYAMLTANGTMRRQAVPGDLQGVHVLMAAKLMTPRAYNIDYEYDRRGEDIGWSLAVRQHGMHLAWTGKVTSKHCMNRADLDKLDHRCGY